MNTRGLMELVVLNIGYDLGVLSPEIFSMMVLMALVTTIMTGPALDLINKFMPEKNAVIVPDKIEKVGKYKILVAFGSPEKGAIMLRLANSFIKKAVNNASVTALHLASSNEINQFNIEEQEKDTFQYIKDEALKLELPIITLFKPTQDIDREITETANIGNFDLLLVGVGRSLFEGTLLGKVLGFTTKIINPERLYETITGKEKLFENAIFDERTKQIIKSAHVPVGIFIEKELKELDNIFIPLFSISDSFLLIYAQKLIHNSAARISIIDANGVIKQNPELKEAIRAIEQIAPNHIAILKDQKLDKSFLLQQDLMLISIDSWKKTIETRSVWLSQTPSVLIIKP